MHRMQIETRSMFVRRIPLVYLVRVIATLSFYLANTSIYKVGIKVPMWKHLVGIDIPKFEHANFQVKPSHGDPITLPYWSPLRHFKRIFKTPSIINSVILESGYTGLRYTDYTTACMEKNFNVLLSWQVLIE